MNRTGRIAAAALLALSGAGLAASDAKADSATFSSIAKAQSGVSSILDASVRTRAAGLVSDARGALSDNDRATARALAQEALDLINGTDVAAR